MDDLVILNADYISVIQFDDKNMVIEYQMNNQRLITNTYSDAQLYLKQRDELKRIFKIGIIIGK